MEENYKSYIDGEPQKLEKTIAELEANSQERQENLENRQQVNPFRVEGNAKYEYRISREKINEQSRDQYSEEFDGPERMRRF